MLLSVKVCLRTTYSAPSNSIQETTMNTPVWNTMANVFVVLQSTALRWPNHSAATLVLGIKLRFAEEAIISVSTKIPPFLLSTTPSSLITSLWDATLRESTAARLPGDRIN